MESDRCPLCKSSSETVEHFILLCPSRELCKNVLLICRQINVLPEIGKVLSNEKLLDVIRPPVYGSKGRTYKMLVMYFFSPRVLRGPSTDRPETLPHDRKLVGLDRLSPKIPEGSPPKNWGPKRCKISVDFGSLQTLIANISGTAKDIQNRPTLQTMTIPPAFNEKGPVNFGPLTAWNYM